MKLTFEDKVKIYKERKHGFTFSQLQQRWKITKTNIQYLVRLADRHGIDILHHVYHEYSIPFNEIGCP